MTVFRKYLGVIVGVIFLGILFFHDRLRDYDEGRYHKPPPEEIIAANKIKFKEVSKQYGLGEAIHDLYSPNKNPVVKKFLPFVTVRPYVSVVDFNQDGYMDIFFLETLPDKPNRLYINQEGKGFKDLSEILDVLSKKGPHSVSVSAWADFNNDGKIDLFTTDHPCFKVFLQKENMVFEEVEEKPDYCSFPDAINLLDFNRDGNLDIFAANYFKRDMTGKASSIFYQLIGLTSKFEKGGEKNVIFLGDGKGHFKSLVSESLERDRARSTAAGVAYVNDDKWPDLFVANDYTFDEMYLNAEGKDLVNVTDQYIPRFYHGFSGMNSDFADYNLDGQLDLFVTYGWGPPSAIAPNILWEKAKDGSRYIEAGKKNDVYKCGWGWGAKFADYDLDGDLDLFVTNGVARGRNATSFKESKSINFLRTQVRSMPIFLREPLIMMMEEKVPDFANSDLQYYGFERNCLFSQHEGKFYDVAPYAGIDDLENGRSMVMLDIDNDGLMDVAIGNADAPLLLYRNVSETNGNWVGFSLENKFGLPYHGATIYGVRSDQKPLKEELFVGNGGRGMNDPRIHFGLGQHTLQDSRVIVMWPDGQYEQFENIELNKYNKIQYGTGKTND